ncbi:MAG: hypothetical protein ACRC1K_13100 [Planctomycetia bacterium]
MTTLPDVDAVPDARPPSTALFFGGGLFGRLVWQELRPWAWFLGLAAMVAAVVVGKSLVDGLAGATYEKDVVITTVLAVGGWALFCGLASFRGEAVNAGFRHPAERGLSPTLLLAAKLTVWLPAMLFGLAVFCALPAWKSTDLLWTPFVRNMFAVVVFVGLFLIGMGWAATLRNSLLALAAALPFGVGYYAVNLLLVECDVPWWWSIAPTPLVFLVGVRLQVGHWLQDAERARWSWRPIAFLAPTLALLAVASLVHRATAVPAVPSSGAAYALLSRPPAAEAVETTELYLEAIAEYQKFDTFAPNDEPPAEEAEDAEPAQVPVDPADRPEQMADYLAANQEVIARVTATSRRPRCAFSDRSTATIHTPLVGVQEMRELTRLLAADARRLQQAGDLAGAAEHYHTIFRMARHVADDGCLIQWLVGDAMERVVFAQLPEWSWHDRQTPELLHAMVVSLEQSDGLLDLYPSALQSDWLTTRRVIDQIGAVMMTPNNSGNLIAGIRQFFPWEEARGLRLTDLLFARDLHRALADVNAMAATPPDQPPLRLPPGLPPGVDLNDDDVRRWFRTTGLVALMFPALDSFQVTVKRATMRRRMMTAFLGVREYQLRHDGRLPESLEALVGAELARRPIDPWDADQATLLYPPAGLAAETRFETPGRTTLYEALERLVDLPAGTRFVGSIDSPFERQRDDDERRTMDALLPLLRSAYDAED